MLPGECWRFLLDMYVCVCKYLYTFVVHDMQLHEAPLVELPREGEQCLHTSVKLVGLMRHAYRGIGLEL